MLAPRRQFETPAIELVDVLNIKGLPLLGPARTTCNAMPLMWKTRNSRGDRIPDGVIRISHRAILPLSSEPRSFTFRRPTSEVFAGCEIVESSFARDNLVVSSVFLVS